MKLLALQAAYRAVRDPIWPSDKYPPEPPPRPGDAGLRWCRFEAVYGRDVYDVARRVWTEMLDQLGQLAPGADNAVEPVLHLRGECEPCERCG